MTKTRRTVHRNPKKRPVLKGKVCDCGQPAVLETSGRHRWCQSCLDKVPIVHSLHYPDAPDEGEERDRERKNNRKYQEPFALHLPDL